jgi:drug/metabolite transporter (DMT)-like permease
MGRRAIAYALLSAALFGASTPLAKLLVGETAPLVLSGLLYLGSGFGLAAWLAVRGERPALPRKDWPWLAAAIGAGGVIGPALLMYGLVRTDGATASLLLNLEAVFTALIAWIAFRENVDRRIFAGMVAIVAGGAVLSFQGKPDLDAGIVLIAGACLAWAIDNNLTRRVSGADAATVACLKGLVAGAVSLAIGLAAGATLPAAPTIAAAGALGFVGYGVSLALFVIALRNLGTARTGAYFSVAPFFGAVVALVFLKENANWAFWTAAALMAAGVWLHLTERHEHLHTHPEMEHEHPHEHDEHHRHEHDFAWDGKEPHSHAHRHGALRHGHPHYPDLHHRHSH